TNEKILEEYNTVKNNVGLFDFSIEGKIKVSGNGRVDFINNLVSNDIKKLEVNNGIYAAFLDKFGKVLSDCVIYKFENFILINLNIIGKINIIKKLKDEAPLVKSEIEDITLKYGLFSLQGPKSIELLKEIINDNLDLKNQYQCTIKKITIKEKNNSNENNNQLINNKTNARTTSGTNSAGIEKNKNNIINNNKIEIIVTKNKRTTEDGYDIFVPASMYKEFKELILEKGKKYNLKIINNETYNILRLEAKIPLYGIDFNQNNILPEIIEKAISYEKGCFLGQEIVARVKSLAKGITAKKLMFLEIDSKEVPEKNSKIMKDNNEVGYITSAAFSPELNKVVALGFLNKGYYDPGSIVTINNSKAIIKLL
ncbi:MAG: aminomethyl transferase family protein, partial [Nanoarchaeota archaeon]|nr:aminomethyl transferase family protein [Nanoarchaeota archaeon]